MIKIAQNQLSHLVFTSLQALQWDQKYIEYSPNITYSLKYIREYCTWYRSSNLDE